VAELLAFAYEVADALETLDGERYKSLLHPEVVLVTVPDWPDGGEFHGRDACWRFLQGFLAVFPPGEGRFEFVDPIEAGDRFVATLRRVASGERSGAQVVFEFAMFVKIRDGMLLRQEFHRSRDEAMAAFAAAA
jgi:ketosteroid isomerase-like protein